MKIYPYNSASASVKALSKALEIKRLKREGKPITCDVLVNWGCSSIPREIKNNLLLNAPGAVARASNKLQAFEVLQGHVPIPQWTTSPQDASEWLLGGSVVVARDILNGNSGKGIRILEGAAGVGEVGNSPLYTKYIKKQEEYRVHIFRGEAIMLQRKARKKEVADDQVNWKVRNHANGFIFAHKDVVVPPDGISDCILAIGLLGLDFGAVDLLEDRAGKCYILEVNTAPGLEGETLTRYTEAFRKMM